MKQSYFSRWGHERTHFADGSARRDRRRAEAMNRNAKWCNKTRAEKLAILAERPGSCAKQINKIMSEK